MYHHSQYNFFNKQIQLTTFFTPKKYENNVYDFFNFPYIIMEKEKLNWLDNLFFLEQIVALKNNARLSRENRRAERKRF